MRIALAIMILFPFALIPCEAQQRPEAKYTLEKILDSPRIRPIQIEESSFTETWYLLSLIMSEDIASKSDVAGFLQIASDLRFLSSTDREGKRKMPEKSGSARTIFQTFANQWEVLILIDGNTVYIVDEGDEKRFKHSVAIRREIEQN